MASPEEVKIFSLGESALTVEFGNEISTDLNGKAIALARHFEHNPFVGYVEAVPAYASTTIFFDLVSVRTHFPEFRTAFDAVHSLITNALSHLNASTKEKLRQIEIPVSFLSENAPDLEYISEYSGLPASEVVNIFLEREYRVYMLGFLPGFAYMGEVDERIAVPRRESPRALVPKGSVGIAGRQTGIYSLESPGGWQIIGKTDLRLFTPENDTPCLLRPGDTIQFVDASK